MRARKPIDGGALLKEAKDSECKEAYKTLDRNPNFRIGIGVRLTSLNAPSFFIEILIYLCPDTSKTDLKTIEKGLTCLKALQTRNYSITYQNGNCISCETTTPTQKISEEYAAAKSLMKLHFG